MPAVVFGQSTDGWELEAPSGSVQLISVGQSVMANFANFSFKNISGKAILEFWIDTGHGSMNGIDAFTIGRGGIAPDASFGADFDTRSLSFVDNNTKKLHVAAIVFADGSEVGSLKAIGMLENEMLGVALETQRISNLLLARPDASFSGYDNVLESISSKLPQTDYEAAEALKGMALPGISQAYVNERLARPEPGLMVGVIRARQFILTEINKVKLADAREMAGTRDQQLGALKSRAHALSDLAQKYSARSDLQARYIKAISRASNASPR